ncbi:hypothetical protein [Silvimonas iriomotensis]|uniref:Uncharacterized protein n=1 Tax=Silvimonas iriomotensis TaxID=449662 RepID=A0ABQ2P9Y3_9NEIS|nr:hypothetical protein [Silvimonas iriomotensis]GGP22064.1 hypothetical protein GCM10010970_23320 [Silvimonas iriomotensis]
MTDENWKAFFFLANQILGQGDRQREKSESWCSWTTFGRLTSDCGYWQSGLPSQEHILDYSTADNGPWGQPFLYTDIAHIIIPREFYWETSLPTGFRNGSRSQNIDVLSQKLSEKNITHRITELVLEIKLY